GNQVFELDNSNNVAGRPIDVTLLPPDLVVTAFTADTSAQAGGPLTVSWKVANAGTGDTIVSGWQDRLVLSANNTLGDEDDRVLSGFDHNGKLNPDGMYARTATI